MPLSEADTRAKLIDPAIHARGWTEDLIRREETAGAIEIVGRHRPRRRAWAHRLHPARQGQPRDAAGRRGADRGQGRALAAGHGLEQAKGYAACKRLNVPFVLLRQRAPVRRVRPATRPDDARHARWPSSRPGRAPRPLRGTHGLLPGRRRVRGPSSRPTPAARRTRRYYQDAAIRAVLEKARARRRAKRALLSLATGAGKTFIAVNLLQAHRRCRAACAGRCSSATATSCATRRSAPSRTSSAPTPRRSSSGKPQKNARILVATYQTLGVDTDEADANFLTRHYPANYFSHIVIDECHRSAWGKWSQVLTRNPDAVQIGLTATPRQLELPRAHRGGAGRRADHRRQPPPLRRAGLRVRHGARASRTATWPPARSSGATSSSTTAARRARDRRRPARPRGQALRDAPTGELSPVAEARSTTKRRHFEDRCCCPTACDAMCRRPLRAPAATRAGRSRRRSSSARATRTPTTWPSR